MAGPKYISRTTAASPIIPAAAVSSNVPYNLVQPAATGNSYTYTQALNNKGVVGYLPTYSAAVLPAGVGRA
jgi:hypothetical protein